MISDGESMPSYWKVWRSRDWSDMYTFNEKVRGQYVGGLLVGDVPIASGTFG